MYAGKLIAKPQAQWYDWEHHRRTIIAPHVSHRQPLILEKGAFHADY